MDTIETALAMRHDHHPASYARRALNVWCRLQILDLRRSRRIALTDAQVQDACDRVRAKIAQTLTDAGLYADGEE